MLCLSHFKAQFRSIVRNFDKLCKEARGGCAPMIWADGDIGCLDKGTGFLFSLK